MIMMRGSNCFMKVSQVSTLTLFNISHVKKYIAGVAHYACNATAYYATAN